MTRKALLDLGPSLVVALGIILASLAAVLTTESGWWVMTGPLLLSLSVVGADLLHARLAGESSAPSPAALLLGGSFLLASAIVAISDPFLVALLIPVIGSTGWVTLFLRRPAGGPRLCNRAKTPRESLEG
jgi:hypothetical protein